MHVISLDCYICSYATLNLIYERNIITKYLLTMGGQRGQKEI